MLSDSERSFVCSFSFPAARFLIQFIAWRGENQCAAGEKEETKDDQSNLTARR
jgi:hypothetical protein